MYIYFYFFKCLREENTFHFFLKSGRMEFVDEIQVKKRVIRATTKVIKNIYLTNIVWVSSGLIMEMKPIVKSGFWIICMVNEGEVLVY